MHMDSWDLLWSVTAKAALAADLLRHHQMLAIVPGLLAVRAGERSRAGAGVEAGRRGLEGRC